MERRVSFRMDKINSSIQKALSSIINNEIRNPNLDNLVITVTEVQTAPDFSSAKVFISALGGLEKKDLIIKELEEAEGFIKRELGAELALKRMPALRFIYDDSLDQGSKIMDLLEKIHKS